MRVRSEERIMCLSFSRDTGGGKENTKSNESSKKSLEMGKKTFRLLLLFVHRSFIAAAILLESSKKC